MTFPVFEHTSSTLYYSNDGRLRLSAARLHPQSAAYFELELDGEAVFATQRRELADAYIAGYDLAAGAEQRARDSWGPGYQR